MINTIKSALVIPNMQNGKRNKHKINYLYHTQCLNFGSLLISFVLKFKASKSLKVIACIAKIKCWFLWKDTRTHSCHVAIPVQTYTIYDWLEKVA